MAASKSSKVKIINGSPLPNIPWQERPAASKEIIWRYNQNPVLTRDLVPNCNSLFNSAVVPFKGKFAGVFRCDNTVRQMQLHVGFSDDGLNWNINPDRLQFDKKDPSAKDWEYGYDPRVIWIEDRWWVTWCNGYHGPTIGVAWTKDFKKFNQVENAFLPANRNGVLFPRKINGRFAMLSRPSDWGHTPFGDMFYSESPDMEFWGRHRWLMRPKFNWQWTKIGAGPNPIETTEGWLIFYHGVLTSCNGYVYSFSTAILDIDEPWKVLYRAAPYLISPRELYETTGDVPNVTFPCATLVDAPSGRIAIYYGCADTSTGLCFCNLDEVVAWTKANSQV